MKIKKNKGQALISLLVFSAMAITIATAATIITINAREETYIFTESSKIEDAADSGIENSLLMLIRNPSYTGGSLNIGDTNITVSITGDDVKTITSVAESSNFIKRRQVTVEYIDNRLTVTSWKSVY